MGKNNLLLGTARGKLGDVVFYRTGGEQRFRTRVRPTNPRTNAQLLQRCVVSTAVKFYSTIAEICNHAFQNYEGNLKNHQRFMKLNIDMLRKLALENVKSWSPLQWNDGNVGNYTWKNSSDIMINPYQISEGDLPTINAEISGNQAYIAGEINGTGVTYADTIEFLGAKAGDQVTMIWIQTKPNTAIVESVYIGRTILMPKNGNLSESLSNQEQDNPENYGNVRLISTAGTTEGTRRLRMIVKNEPIRVGGPQAAGYILSRFENGKWKRSTQFLTIADGYKNLAGLKEAMESYMKDNTSSLYLNQADDKEEIAEANLINELSEESGTKRARKNNKDAE